MATDQTRLFLITGATGKTGTSFAYPIAPGLLDATVVFAQAAAEAGVKSVVNMSQISARREAGSNAAPVRRPRHASWTAQPADTRTRSGGNVPDSFR